MASDYMMMIRLRLNAIFVFLFVLTVHLHSQTAAYTVLIETSKGNMECILYGETPMHADNFVKLAQNGFYNGLLFHRVIRDFMIQSGDPNSRNAAKGVALGYGDPGYSVPAEFHPGLYHKKGALAAARQGDRVNPSRSSNGSQFYIVQGKRMTDAELDAMEKSGSHISFTREQRIHYRDPGGTPHLDYAYTVFGEVVDGFEVIDSIAFMPTDDRDRPVEDIKIIRVSIIK